MEVVIVINPGSTSTKFALYSRDGSVVEKVVRHEAHKLSIVATDQFEYRRELIDLELETILGGVKVVGTVGRGGLLKPIKGGTYKVTKEMTDYLISDEVTNHASNLGAILAKHYAERFNVEAYVVDPVTVDEFADVSRVSGVKWIQRKSRVHALNIKAVVRRACSEIGLPLNKSRFVVAHLGGGISVAAVDGGRIIDVNDAMHGMGPFSPERAGALPIGPLIEKCFSGEVTKKELLQELARESGLKGYCGTSDVQEIMARINNGDRDAEIAIRAMVYQIVKEIGGLAAVFGGGINGVIVTGGMAHSVEITDMIRSAVAFLGTLIVFPGEGELEALAQGAFRVIDGEEVEQTYS